METFWFFNMNGVGVAAASRETYMQDGTVVKPVKKMKEVNPGILCSVIGPYEGLDQYMRFISKRFELNPELTAEMAIEDLKWMISKKEVDAGELMDAINRIKKVMKNPKAYDLEDEIDKFKNVEIIKEIGTTPMSDDEMEKRWQMNLMLNQIKIIDTLPDAFITRALTVDPFTNQVAILNWHEKHSDVPLFNQWGLQKWKPGVIEFGQVILDLRKEYELKKPLFKDESATAEHLQKMITDLDVAHNPEPAELEFMKCTVSTGWRWVEM